MSNAISLSSTVVAAPDQVSCDLAGEAVILNLKDSVYYGLNEVGAAIWNLLQQPRGVAEICGSIMQEYAVDPATCERDILVLLQRLSDHGLVDVQDAPAPVS